MENCRCGVRLGIDFFKQTKFKMHEQSKIKFHLIFEKTIFELSL